MKIKSARRLDQSKTSYQIYYIILLILAITCTFIALYWHYVEGVRGSDQYWYLADTETLISGDEPLTNTVFPGLLLRGGSVNAETLFAHNGPLLHFNALIGKITGAFVAWKLSNLLFMFIAAGFTGLIVSQLVGYLWGCIAILIYILSPTTVWLAGNLLQETYYSALTATLLLLTVWRQQGASVGWLIPIVLLLGSLSHPMYTLLGFLFALQLIIDRKSWVMLIGVIVALIISVLFKDIWYPSSFQPDLKTIIASSKPGMSNMLWKLSDIELSITPELLFAKFWDALRVQFTVARLAVFNLPTNAGLIALGYLLVNHRKQHTYFLAIALIFYVVYFVLIILIQNQFRYQMLIAPISIATIVLALSHLQWSAWGKKVIVITLIIFALIDFSLLRIIRSDSIKERTALKKISSELSDFSSQYRVAIINSKLLPIVFALRPRKCLIINPDILSEKKVDKVLSQFSPDLVITGSGENELNRYGTLLHKIPNKLSSSSNLQLYSHKKTTGK